MGIRFGLQRHFLLKREFDCEFSRSNQFLRRQSSSSSGKELASHYQRKIQKRSSPPTIHLLQTLNPSNKRCGLILCSISFAPAEKVSDSSRKNRSLCRLTQLGKSLFVKFLMNWRKATGQTIKQMILQEKDVCM